MTGRFLWLAGPTLFLCGCHDPTKSLVVVNHLPFPIEVEFHRELVAKCDPGQTVRCEFKVEVRKVNVIEVFELPGEHTILTAEFAKTDTGSRWYDGHVVQIEVSESDLPAESQWRLHDGPAPKGTKREPMKTKDIYPR